MSALVLGRRIIALGVASAILGIILYSQLGRIGYVWLDISVVLSFAMTLIGLLAVLIGSVILAYRASIAWLFSSGLVVGVVGFLIGEFGDINIHGPTAILMFVVFAAVGIGGVLVLIAVTRFVSSRLKREQNGATKS